MANRQELVRLGEGLPIFEERLRDGAETESIVSHVLAVTNGSEEAARRLLDQSLFFAVRGGIWGRSLFVGRETDLWPADEVVAMIDSTLATPWREIVEDVARVALAGVLQKPYFAELYLAMTEDLTGEAGLRELRKALRRGGNGISWSLDGSWQRQYRLIAARPVGFWDSQSLVTLAAHLRGYRKTLAASARGEILPLLPLLIQEADLDLRAVEEAARRRGLVV